LRFSDGTLARIHDWNAVSIDVEIDGRRSRARITRTGDRILVHGPHGDLELCIEPRFEIPGSEETSGGFVARMPGRVIELRVQVGDTVHAGQTVVVLEAMKMEHPMSATEDGIVSEVRVEVGEQVEAGALLLIVEPTEASEHKGDV
jgi:propionyl-CoA carboxylase alpha chain